MSHFPLFVFLALFYLVQSGDCFPTSPPLPPPIKQFNSDNLPLFPPSVHHLLGNGSDLRCGGVLTAPQGEISYKLNGSIYANERCIWIIGVPDAAGYEIKTINLASPINEDGSGLELIYGPTFVYPEHEYPPIMLTVRPWEGSTTLIPYVYPSIVITFSTRANISEGGAGFYLQYTSERAENASGISPLSTHNLFGTPSLDFKYPEGRNAYDNQELATFAFLPTDNMHRGNTSHINYRVDSVDATGCMDSIHIYRFNINEEYPFSKWIYPPEKICGNVTSQDIYHDDMTVILFESDEAEVGKGFWFDYQPN